jgi:hypothetical protein
LKRNGIWRQKTNRLMDNLASELAELKGFIADLKAERAAQKEKEKRESWTKYTSISVVFIAVLAAVASQWAGKYSGRMMVELNDATFHQAEATDQWSYYQANSVKENLYESIQELAPKDTGDAGEAQAAFKAKIDKYEAGKKDSKDKAEALEKQRDTARASASDASKHGGGMGLAVAVFQISIAVASICLVTKKKWLWHASLLLALAATGRMAWVWLN